MSISRALATRPAPPRLPTRGRADGSLDVTLGPRAGAIAGVNPPSRAVDRQPSLVDQLPAARQRRARRLTGRLIARLSLERLARTLAYRCQTLVELERLLVSAV